MLGIFVLRWQPSFQAGSLTKLVNVATRYLNDVPNWKRQIKLQCTLVRKFFLETRWKRGREKLIRWSILEADIKISHPHRGTRSHLLWLRKNIVQDDSSVALNFAHRRVLHSQRFKETRNYAWNISERKFFRKKRSVHSIHSFAQRVRRRRDAFHPSRRPWKWWLLNVRLRSWNET